MISFRPLRRDDLVHVAHWLAQPHVARWWRDPSDIEAVTEKYMPGIEQQTSTEVFIIELDGDAVGLIQRYRHRDHEDWDRAIGIPDAAGIDYLVGEPDVVGRGVGTDAIRRFAGDTLSAYEDVDCVVAAPQQANVASWRALEKAGFVRVWEGQLESDDPSDEGPAFVYVLQRDEAR